jgi:SAM-dependent methyltransferase
MKTAAVVSEIVKTLRRPTRVKALFDPNGRYLLAMRVRGIQKGFNGRALTDAKQDGLVRREYDSYDTYIWHQRSKLDMLQSGGKLGLDGTDLDNYDRKFRENLRQRLESLGFIKPGMSALCLAARLGTEVKAFIDCGCFSVGIDLNPGADNPYVLPGDFHRLVFADDSVDVVYCNALDHAFDLHALLKEVHRVLKPQGRFVADVQLGSTESEKRTAGSWESLAWESSSVITRAFADCGFDIQSTVPFTYPWRGNCLVAAPTNVAMRDRGHDRPILAQAGGEV